MSAILPDEALRSQYASVLAEQELLRKLLASYRETIVRQQRELTAVRAQYSEARGGEVIGAAVLTNLMYESDNDGLVALYEESNEELFFVTRDGSRRYVSVGSDRIRERAVTRQLRASAASFTPARP